MARKADSRRRLSTGDRFIVEFDRLLATGFGRSRAAPLIERSTDQLSRELRSSHKNAAAGLGLRRGLTAAAQSSAAITRAKAGEQAAVETVNWVDQQMHEANTGPGPLAAIGYAGGFAIGLGSRLLGDEAGRRIAGSHDQARARSQRQRADCLAADSSEASQPLVEAFRQQANSKTCLCGPHGHRIKSRPASRLFSRFIK